MQLGSRFLNNVGGINQFDRADSITFTAGTDQQIYLVLVDASLDRTDQEFNPPGRRYCPPATSVLTVTLVNIDTAKVVTRVASQPFAGDLSIWTFPVLNSDPLDGTVTINLTLVEPSRILKANFVAGQLLRCC